MDKHVKTLVRGAILGTAVLVGLVGLGFWGEAALGIDWVAYPWAFYLGWSLVDSIRSTASDICTHQANQ